MKNLEMLAKIFAFAVIVIFTVEVRGNTLNAQSLSSASSSPFTKEAKLGEVNKINFFKMSQLKFLVIIQKCDVGERCVPYYHCLEEDGAKLFNIRIENEALPCESLRTCCEIENIEEKIPDLKVAESCGLRNVDGLGYFSNTKQKESQYGEFPWTMAVLRKLPLDSSMIIMMYMGAGSLIHPSIVLTTSHNLNNTTPNDLAVRGGEWNTMSADEMFPHQDRDVQGVTYHREFNRKNLQNDIALLSLMKPFELAPHINTICLPQLNYKHDSGEKCIATGWGKDKVK